MKAHGKVVILTAKHLLCHNYLGQLRWCRINIEWRIIRLTKPYLCLQQQWLDLVASHIYGFYIFVCLLWNNYY